jgi:hypothetical protein
MQKKNTRNTGKQASRLSNDGRWRSFPKVPHLLQYASSEAYYAKVKIRGKIIRGRLDGHFVIGLTTGQASIEKDWAWRHRCDDDRPWRFVH